MLLLRVRRDALTGDREGALAKDGPATSPSAMFSLPEWSAMAGMEQSEKMGVYVQAPRGVGVLFVVDVLIVQTPLSGPCDSDQGRDETSPGASEQFNTALQKAKRQRLAHSRGSRLPSAAHGSIGPLAPPGLLATTPDGEGDGETRLPRPTEHLHLHLVQAASLPNTCSLCNTAKVTRQRARSRANTHSLLLPPLTP